MLGIVPYGKDHRYGNNIGTIPKMTILTNTACVWQRLYLSYARYNEDRTYSKDIWYGLYSNEDMDTYVPTIHKMTVNVWCVCAEEDMETYTYHT